MCYSYLPVAELAHNMTLGFFVCGHVARQVVTSQSNKPAKPLRT